MTQRYQDETVNRFAIAAAEMLRRDLDPEFAEDSPSLAFLAGHPLDARAFRGWIQSAMETQMDLAYLTFARGREHLGPTNVSIFAERSGLFYTWSECALWAPRDGGPALMMPKGINVCFAHDGRALISMPTRPTKSLSNGIARARIRLARAARQVTDEQLEEVATPFRQAA
ncbi:hypothetical protein ACVWZA_000551 [Sphingomonas sp. UYAg733]